MTVEGGLHADLSRIVKKPDKRGRIATGDQPADECGALAVEDFLPWAVGGVILEREQIGN